MDGLIGLSSSMIAMTMTYPIDVIKTNYQIYKNSPNIQSSKSIKTLDIIKYIYNKKNIKGFFRGLPASLSSQPIFWSVFYQVKSYDINIFSNKVYNNILVNIICGNIGSLVANPFYVLRTRFQVQTQSTTYLNMFKNIYREEGIMKFFAGFPSTCFNNLKLGLQFPLYEYLKNNNYNTFYSASISKLITSITCAPTFRISSSTYGALLSIFFRAVLIASVFTFPLITAL